MVGIGDIGRADEHNLGGDAFASPPSIKSMQILPLDMTDIIQFEQKVPELVSIGYHNGPMYMRDFLGGVEAAARYHSQAIFEYETAKKKAKQKYSIAKLDKADAYLRAKGIKPTDGARESYADMDDDYLAAAQLEAKWKAIAEYLKNKVEIFQRAHDDAKKIFDKTNEPKGSISALPSGD